MSKSLFTTISIVLAAVVVIVILVRLTIGENTSRDNAAQEGNSKILR